MPGFHPLIKNGRMLKHLRRKTVQKRWRYSQKGCMSLIDLWNNPLSMKCPYSVTVQLITTDIKRQNVPGVRLGLTRCLRPVTEMEYPIRKPAFSPIRGRNGLLWPRQSIIPTNPLSHETYNVSSANDNCKFVNHHHSWNAQRRLEMYNTLCGWHSTVKRLLVHIMGN